MSQLPGTTLEIKQNSKRNCLISPPEISENYGMQITTRPHLARKRGLNANNLGHGPAMHACKYNIMCTYYVKW